MKKTLTLGLSVMMILGFALVMDHAVVYGKAKYKITFGHVEPVHSSTHEGAKLFKSIVEKRTNGQVEVLLHPSSELGPGPDQGQMCQTGAIQMAILPTAHLGGIFPEGQVFEIPFLLPTDIYYAMNVMNGPAGDKLSAYLDKRDLLGFAYYPLSYKQFTSNKAIRKPDDFKGLKWRTMAAPLIMESYKVLGASPVSINYHELYTALQLGTADGEENPFWSIGEMKFYEVQKYIMLSNHSVFVSMMIANKAWFDGLPNDIRKIIVDAVKEGIPEVVRFDQKHDHEWYEKIKKDPGTEIIELTPQAVEAFRAKLTPVRDKYIEMVGPSGREVLKAFDDAMGR